MDKEKLRTKCEYSVLLLKPEYFTLRQFDQELIFTDIGAILGPNLLMVEALQISLDQAREIWENVKHQPWSENYYQAMTGQVLVFIVVGSDLASNIKHTLRDKYRPLIEKLTLKRNQDFLVDIFHGSDPESAPRELDVLGIRV